MIVKQLATLAAWTGAVTASLALAPAASAQQGSANQLKVAIVYNILRFVEFAPADVGTTLQFCASSSASGNRELSILGGQRAGSRLIAFRKVDTGRFAGCNVIYLGSANSSEISNAGRTGALVIGEGSSFITRGGTVGLVRMGNQYRFEVNMRAARSAQLGISSKLLRLAARVQQ